jgi:hypothetical protein
MGDSPRLWRTLIRVMAIQSDFVIVDVPAWINWGQDLISIPLADFPVEVVPQLKRGYRFHARVDLDATEASTLRIEQLEF